MRWNWWMAVAVVLIAMPVSVPATTILKVPIEEMAANVDLVIRAVVLESRVVVHPDDERIIDTRVTLGILETMKGHVAAPTLAIVLPGGRTPAYTLAIPGMPSFHEGEEVVVFLERTSAGWIPAGLSMGKYSLTRDAATGAVRARRDMSRLASMVRDQVTGTLVEAHSDDPQDDLDLEVLRQTIRRGVQMRGGVR